jgi:hypothetical protein
MILMTVTGFVLLVGITLTLWWGGTSDETWEPRVGDAASRRVRLSPPDDGLPVRTSVLRYLRGVAIALVGGSGPGLS